MKKRTSIKSTFDFDNLANIMGIGIKVIDRELQLLATKSEEKGLSDSESKTLIAYLSTLREIKKDYLAEVASVQKELKSLSTEELTSMLNGGSA